MNVYIILFAGFIVSYLLYTKFGMRSPGVIAAPLLAIYALQNHVILIVVIIVGVLVYVMSLLVYKKWFIYGRRLFLILCAISVILSTPIIYLLRIEDTAFTTILPAIFAYNLTTNGNKLLSSIGVLVGEIVLLIGIGILTVMYL